MFDELFIENNLVYWEQNFSFKDNSVDALGEDNINSIINSIYIFCKLYNTFVLFCKCISLKTWVYIIHIHIHVRICAR